MVTTSIEELVEELWALAGGSPEGGDRGPLAISGARHVLASVFDVTGIATATVAVANAAVAGLVATRAGVPPPAVHVDTRAASAAFVDELLFTPAGWERPPIFDPVAGDYRSADGWIRLHTNYAGHRQAALAALGLDAPTDRDAVAAAVADRTGEELEQAVVDRGGAAAVMHDAATWRAHPHGLATVAEPPVAITTHGTQPDPHWVTTPAARPLAGIRVLDLTRVIAGPVATRFLAAHGADVLRLDPPGFDEVAALLPVVTAGKRCAALDLTSDDGRRRFADLVAEADVVVHGLRPGAMEALGFGTDALRSTNPGAVTARLDAYGWCGPWASRRGFDSLVQMSCGIAAAGGAAAGVDGPRPLPAQALDHGTGYLLAAAVVLALTARAVRGSPADVTASLLGTADVLVARPVPGGLDTAPPSWGEGDLAPTTTAWGRAHAVPAAGAVAGFPTSWDHQAGPLGRAEPVW